MTNEKEMTAPIVSVGADTEQSSQNLTGNSLTDFDPDFKGFDEMQREILRMMDPSYLKTVSMSELLDNVYQSKPPLVDGLLYRGTYLFVGAPKLGKSFLMTQLAYHISTGTPLWNYPARKGTVLYLALEDDYRRLQERSYRMFGTAENESLFFSVSAGQLGSGLDEQLTNFLREHPDTSLIIIDTLQKVREVGGDNYSYANDYQIITRLKALADIYGICLLLVHHTRKQQSDDKFDMISGTNGLLGAADTQIGDYLLPDLELPEKEQQPIGVWGQRHWRYLKEHRRASYATLLTSGKLNSYLADIDRQAEEMFLRLVKQMAEMEGITEQLKADNQMEWVGRMNNIRNRAMEIVNGELIYTA